VTKNIAPSYQFRFGIPALVCAALALLFGACTPEPRKNSGRPLVLTTFTILADMAKNVAGEHADVESLIKPGSEIHGYEPTPKDIVKTQQASLVLWNGMNLERWFEKFFENVKGVPQAVLTEGIEPMGISEGPYTGRPNPHAWMSPANAVRYVENIRAALAKLDPAHAEAYAANAAAYTAKIRALEAPVREKLARIPAEQRWLVSSEGAFSYLCRDYGMQQVQNVIDVVRKNKIPVVFSESTVSDKPAQQVAKEAGARYGGVLYVDSLTDASGPAPTYLRLLETNADTIVRAFVGEEK
jgi:manganese/iron transport system substrate-binding protein